MTLDALPASKRPTVTTEGFRDILEIAYERRHTQYDINLEKTDFLVPRDRSFTIPERMAADGSVLLPLDEQAVPGLLSALDASGAEAVAICLLHSYANPANELRLRALIRAARPDLAISVSSDVSPEAREFDRLCTTVANGYIQPLMAGYLGAFEALFADEGLRCPILMMTASGGMTTLETAARFPVRLVESGPAGGAILAAHVAARCGLDEVLSFDMGGTTAKLCLIDRQVPQTSRAFEIARAQRFVKGSGMPVRIPVIEMIEIGAGGGSIASVDRLGRLTVGPRSAGSEPGPVAFGRGGSEPTVTDADIVLGYIRSESFAEGQFQLRPDAAAWAILEAIGAPLDLPVELAADGIARIVDESMASAGRMHAVESGKDLGSRTMIAFGGNGPLHACRVARSAGIDRILIPENPSVGSAVGFLFAAVSFEIVRSWYTRLETLDVAELNARLNAMEGEATAIVRLGAATGELAVRRSAFMRYHGQGHEIEIELPAGAVREDDIPALIRAFERAYSVQFSRPVPGMSIEILNWVVRVAIDGEDPPDMIRTPAGTDAAMQGTARILCDVTGQPREAALVARATLRPGQVIAGPALITEPQTTTFVGADFTASVDSGLNLIMTRNRTLE